MEITSAIQDLCRRSVGDVVAEDYRRAAVFERYGIDFCCGGDRTVKEACDARGVSCDEIMQALVLTVETSSRQGPRYLDVRSWEPDYLVRHIVNVHHRYVREHGPILRELTQTVARVHGDTNPETARIAALVDELVRDLDEHAAKEEEELFPYVEALCVAARAGAVAPPAALWTAGVTIEVLEHEHDDAGALMREIRTLSEGYAPPEGACATFRIAYAKLKEFEENLHRHVHLENNVLFPAAARLAEQLARLA